MDGTRYTRTVLGSLKEAKIIASKPVLPAGKQILTLVLDHLSVPDLISCARTSKLLREMVYDDTRWVRKLRAMGCWDENAARMRTDEAARRRNLQEAQIKERSASNGLPINNAAEQFDLVTLSGLNDPISPISPPPDQDALLEVLSRARSVRGAAKQEFGRIYGALRPLYRDALRSKRPSNARVFRMFRDPNQQAQMLSQLVRFSRSDFTSDRGPREDKLGQVVGAFEDAVSHEFEEGVKAGDVEGRMKKYAQVLVVLNDGRKGLEIFIENNIMFKNSTHFGSPSQCISLGDPDIFLADECSGFFSRLSESTSAQLHLVDRVFAHRMKAKEAFLERVMTEIMIPFLNGLLSQTEKRDVQVHLEALSAVCDSCINFVESLKPRGSTDGQFLENSRKQIADTFNPYLETYLAQELALFKRLSEAEVTQWESQLDRKDASVEAVFALNVNRQVDKKDFLSSFKKVVMAPVTIIPGLGKSFLAPPSSAGTPQNRTPRASTPSGTLTPGGEPSFFMAHTSGAIESSQGDNELAAKAALVESKLRGIKSLFSLEMALNLVKMAKAGIERAAVFRKLGSSFDSEVCNQCEAIYVQLLRTLGSRHVGAGFEKALKHLSDYDPRGSAKEIHQSGVAPLLMFLELVNVGDLIQQMLEVFYEQELLKTAIVDRNDMLGIAIKERKRFEQMLDGHVAAGLNKGIEVLISEIEYTLATTQSREDFQPEITGGDTNDVADISPTRTAFLVVDKVSAHTNMLEGGTDKHVLDVFNQEVGLRLFHLLCKHLKQQRISVRGSIRLISDMNRYFGFVQSLRNKDLLQYFIALREVSQIYLIAPSDAKEIATFIADNDRFLGIFRAEEVYEFAERRADWYQVKPRVEKAMYGIGCVMM